MLFATIRLIFFGIAFTISFFFIRKSHLVYKRRCSIVAFAATVILTTISALIPIENAFVTFSSPKSAYNYNHSASVELIVDGNESDFVVGAKGETDVYAIVPRSNNAWKIGMGLDTKRIVQTISDGITIYVYQCRFPRRIRFCMRAPISLRSISVSPGPMTRHRAATRSASDNGHHEPKPCVSRVVLVFVIKWASLLLAFLAHFLLDFSLRLFYGSMSNVSLWAWQPASALRSWTTTMRPIQSRRLIHSMRNSRPTPVSLRRRVVCTTRFTPKATCCIRWQTCFETPAIVRRRSWTCSR